MKIAIHNSKIGFHPQWIKYCDENDINYKLVNCYDSDIIKHLQDCDGLMWHWGQQDYKAQMFARQFILSVEKMGMKVFPNFDSCWHFDDKVAQKYLLEAIEAPLVPTYVFYDKKSAYEWINKTSFPKVFKLKGGAGSLNVKLVHNQIQAKRLVDRAFGQGFPLISKKEDLKNRLWQIQRDKTIEQYIYLLRGIYRVIAPKGGEEFLPVQKGYVYFQDFIPDLDSDYRLKVIGNKCWGKIRYCRKNDFRASGSNIADYSNDRVPIELIKLSFEISKTLNLQSCAFDYVYQNGSYYLLEISYTFGNKAGELQGYWDTSLKFYNKQIKPEEFMIEDFLDSIKKKNEEN